MVVENGILHCMIARTSSIANRVCSFARLGASGGWSFSLRFRRAIFAALTLGLLAGAVPLAQAAPVPGLYQGMVPATDRSPKGLATVYPDALRQVAVRVTGRPAAASDPALAPLYADANRFVQTWRPAGTGQVAVGFDAQAVEAALVAAGQPLWPADRPVVFAAVVVERVGPGGVARTLVTGAVTGDERRALERVAQARGLVLAWPAVELAPALMDLAQSGPVEALLAFAREQKAQGVLWLRTSAVAGSAAQWSWATDGLAGSGRGDAATVLQGFADALAARDASAPGAALAQLVVMVSGVDSLTDYATVLNAIEALPTVRELEVTSVAGNVLRLRVRVRGDAGGLLRVLAQEGRLAADAAGTATGDGSLRLKLQK
jgi:hypothetical protein